MKVEDKTAHQERKLTPDKIDEAVVDLIAVALFRAVPDIQTWSRVPCDQCPAGSSPHTTLAMPDEVNKVLVTLCCAIATAASHADIELERVVDMLMSGDFAIPKGANQNKDRQLARLYSDAASAAAALKISEYENNGGDVESLGNHTSKN